MSATYICPRCHCRKTANEFYFSHGKRSSYCRTCNAKYNLQLPTYRQSLRKRLTNYHAHRKHYRQIHLAWSRNRRLQLIRKYGGKCVRCGFVDWRALQFDHIVGVGVREYRRGTSKYYRSILEDKSGKFQLLCANCNWIKRYENNEHGANTLRGGD